MEKDIISAEIVQKLFGKKEVELRVKVVPPGRCPQCGCRRMHKHGMVKDTPVRKVLDSIVAGKLVYISWVPFRVKCPACGKTITCRPEGVQPWARLSDNAIRAVVACLKTLNYASVADLTGLNRNRVWRLAQKHVGTGIMPESGTPVVLTLDEASYRHNDYTCVVGELSPTKRLLTILEDDLVSTIENYLRELKRRGVVVEAFVIDMKDAWRRAIKRVFPEAKVIVDPFHLIQDANRRLDEARKVERDATKVSVPRYPLVKPREKLTPKERKQLDQIKHRFPALYELYQLKEDLRDIVRCNDESRAQQLLTRWLINADNAQNAEGRVWANTIRAWRQELLNLVHFTAQGRRYTNGYIEGKIAAIKMIKRISFGFRNRMSFIKKAFLGCCSRTEIPQLLI
ncbi:MAG TPA: ISL3 family transposase [Firmicutes bacterium]|nr:ISL3 family transposase [Candidatus Fermentithermobacillaceae bacterium]